jgi:hypothetical protein
MSDDKLQAVLDVLEIQRLKALYCQIVDASVADPSLSERLRELCVPECTSDFGFGSMANRDEIVAFGAQSATMVDMFWHGLSSPLVEVDGDTARASWTVTARSKRKGADEITTVIGRYIDRLVRTPDGWRFTVMDFRIEG